MHQNPKSILAVHVRPSLLSAALPAHPGEVLTSKLEYHSPVVDHPGGLVAWVRVDTQTILSIHHNIITQNPRISLSYNDHRSWYLHIKNVQEVDRGWYMCQVNTDPMRSRKGYLQVVVPPVIIDNMTSTDMVVREGINATLTCRATGYPEPYVMWRREDGQDFNWNGESVPPFYFAMYIHSVRLVCAYKQNSSWDERDETLSSAKLWLQQQLMPAKTANGCVNAARPPRAPALAIAAAGRPTLIRGCVRIDSTVAVTA
ncbi:Lachesin [Eumeta japonica]|uniref:Lachesin n=1 Tax=Eumeta variegata TaxID=151549 RepID=A0A4C1ZC90_EUMVA|nr:Lachesin [Eumeta japonica]